MQNTINQNEINMLRTELELLMRERDALLRVTGAAAGLIAEMDSHDLPITTIEAADLLAEADIYTNANMIPFDPATPLHPSGLRLGTPALSTRGMKEKEMKLIGLWIAAILRAPQDKKLRLRIKNEVKILTKKFPIY